ncbi:MAG: polysaccharide deacetylase family protein [Peptostreptococcaceae bacterium]
MKKNLTRIKSFISSLIFFVFTLTFVFGVVYSVKYIGSNMKSEKMPINKVETKENKVSLTFDIAGGTSNIYDVLDVLDKYEVKASFFLVGNWVDNNEELVKEISKRGHDIGNHSNTHANMKELSEKDLINELNITSDKIEAITGEKTTMYRPPFGEFDKDSLEVCEELGYKSINWDVDSLDWKEVGVNHVVDNVLKNTKSGTIVLFHGDVNYNEQYLDMIIKKLKEEYTLVPLSDLIYNESYEIDSKGTQRPIGK